MLRCALIVFVLVLITACGAPSRSTTTSSRSPTGSVAASTVAPTATPRPTNSPEPTDTPRPSAPAGAISRGDLGDAWPFTVDAGVLSCVGQHGVGAVVFTANDKTYAVNGVAKQQHTYPDIDEIWANDPKTPGLKKDIGPIIERGLALCP